MSARKMTSRADQLPLESASAALRDAPDRDLLDDLVNAATLLSLGDDSGIGKTNRDGLRDEIAAASAELLRRWEP